MGGDRIDQGSKSLPAAGRWRILKGCILHPLPGAAGHVLPARRRGPPPAVGTARFRDLGFC